MHHVSVIVLLGVIPVVCCICYCLCDAENMLLLLLLLDSGCIQVV
jgi:hypothetical protein